MKSKEKKIIVTATVLLVVISILSLLFGSNILNLSELIEGVFNSSSSKYGFIIYEYRIPRLLVSIMVGMALAIAGTIFQGVLRNPLASTDVLGIGKGAGFFACLILTIPAGKYISLPMAAIIGGLGVGLLIYVLTRKTNFKGTSIIIMGVAISALFDAGIQYLNVNNKGNIQTVLLWLTGSVWSRDWHEVYILLPFIIIFVPVAIIMARKIDILSLGDTVAINLGERVNVLRVFLLFIAVILTASSVSVSGTIGFVGLISPHIAKSIVGYKHKYVIHFSGLVGAILLVVADLVGRTVFAPIEIPVGIVTAMVGAPYFLYLLLKKK